MRLWIMLGGFSGGLSVLLGAMGAHSLKGQIAEKSLNAFHTGTQYQFFHSLALILVGILVHQLGDENSGRVKKAGWFFVAGILLFSGSLYGLALGGPRFLGPLTPLGGLSFMTGWVLLALSIPKK